VGGVHHCAKHHDKAIHLYRLGTEGVGAQRAHSTAITVIIVSTGNR
jgi:hypothetical protein